MPKKRIVKKIVKSAKGKVKKSAFSRKVKEPKAKAPKFTKSSMSKLDQILSVEKSILSEEKRVELKEDLIKKEEQKVEEKEEKIAHEEKTLEKLEASVAKSEQKESDELAKLEELEKKIQKDVAVHPLTKITFKDFIKGLVGAFIGLAVHYTFTYGVEISERIDMTRVTLLYLFSFFIGLLFIYATGFRKIEDPKILMFMPVRLMVLYIASVLMSIVVLFIFYPEFGHGFVESYKMVGGVLLAAVVGSCTADLIGKE